MQFAGSPFSIKSLDDGGRIEGLLADFTVTDLGGDKLEPGCLTKTLAARTTPLPMLLHHDMKRPIGSWKSWHQDGAGLHVEGNLTLSTRDAQEAHALAKDGALGGLSIGWMPVKAATNHKGERIITEAELFEGSLVSIPMNPKTRVSSVKFFANPTDISQDEIREVLQGAGMRARMAKAIAATRWKAIEEAGDEAELAAILNASIQRLQKA